MVHSSNKHDKEMSSARKLRIKKVKKNYNFKNTRNSLFCKF